MNKTFFAYRLLKKALMYINILIISMLISTISFSQMTEKTYGWAFFDNEASKFSESFKEQMSKQLEKRFNQFLNIENAVSEYDFMLFVGQSDMQLSYRDGFGFAIVEVISSGMFSNYLTAYWTIADDTQIESATKIISLDSNNIEFGWCTDFDTQIFLEHTTTVQKIDSTKYDFVFDIEYDFQLYPDLSIEFRFNTEPSEQDLETIQKTVTLSLPEAYVGKISLDDGKYISIIDFQNQKFKEGTTDLLEVVNKLNDLAEKEIIDLIRIK